MRIKANSVYKPLFNNTDRYLVLKGSAGSGKSVFASQKTIARCITEKGHRLLVIRKVARTLKESVVQELLNRINELGIGHEFTYNRSEHKFTHSLTGNEILCMGLDDPEKIKSISGITSIWVEEATELSKEDFSQLDTRLRGHTVNYKQIVLSFNPVDVHHWIKDYFFDQQWPQSGLNRTLLETTWRDNEFLDDDYKRVLMAKASLSKNHYQVYYLGEWGKPEVLNPFMSAYDSAKHEANVTFQSDRPIIMSVDFNIDPFCVNFAHVYSDGDGDHCHVFDEISIYKGSIPELADRVRDRYGDYLYYMEVTGDRSGTNRTLGRDNQSYFQQLQNELGLSRNQFKLPPNPTHKKSRAHCNYVLFHHPDFKINPQTCPQTVFDMQTVEYANDKIVKSNRAKDEQRADHLDNVRYLINTYLRNYAIGKF